MWLAASITDHIYASIPRNVHGAFLRRCLRLSLPPPGADGDAVDCNRLQEATSAIAAMGVRSCPGEGSVAGAPAGLPDVPRNADTRRRRCCLAAVSGPRCLCLLVDPLGDN